MDYSWLGQTDTTKRKEQQKRWYNSHTQSRQIEVGDAVWLKISIKVHVGLEQLLLNVLAM